MRNTAFILAAVIFCAGWTWFSPRQAAIEIGPVRVSAEEFETALARAQIPQNDPLKKKEFLDAFIARKLMLLEAEKMGLDKDPDFLSSLQLFWEQSLLKLVIAKKMDEITGGLKVSANEISEYYVKNKAFFSERSLSESRGEIKLILFKEKQRQAIEQWSSSLREGASVHIDFEQLGLDAQ